ncbi:MAG: PQQ-dependent sugar dehydrogenase, partial [Burkholderiaceae bacterium]|nr:PQQ-dependent sugar dehydrogenase [Burkholderiaceae bacterium]
MMVAATAALWLGSTGLAQAQLEPTRADPASLEVSTIADGLASPWGLAFLPDGAMLVTEKAGQLRRITSKGEVGQPIAGVPKVFARGQGGLLDVALSPGFNKDRRVYLSFAEAGDDAA